MRAPLLLLTLAALTVAPARGQTPVPPFQPGWLGIDGSLVTALGARPVVIVRTVAAGSPAARAGLGPGDTVIALDGTPPSVARFRSLRTQLRAGDRLELTVRRGPSARTVSVLAAPRPSEPELPVVMRLDVGSMLPTTGVVPGGARRWMLDAGAPTSGDPRTTPVSWTTPYLVGLDRVAGARITPLNPGLGHYFGTERGLLVIEVTPGTPAHAARILAGDVLLSVGDVEVDELRSLRLAVATAPAERTLRVVLMRQGRTIELELPR
jgi:S1-C subfamily serine protease